MKLSSTDFLQRDSDFLKVKGKIVEQLENADTCSSSTNFFQGYRFDKMHLKTLSNLILQYNYYFVNQEFHETMLPNI